MVYLGGKKMTEGEQYHFMKAKAFMADILQRKDEGMYRSYVDNIADNIAMIIWNSRMEKEFTTFRAEDCDKAAKRIMAVIFDIKER